MPIFTGVTSGTDTTNGTVFTTASVSPTGNRLLLLAVVTARDDAVNASPPSSVTGNGLTWVEIGNILYDTAGTIRETLTLYRAMGASPSTGALTITLPVTHQSCAWSLSQSDADIDTSGTNGSGAVVQSAADLNYFATLAAFGHVDNAAYGAYGVPTIDTLVPGSGYTQLHAINGSLPSSALLTQYKDANDTTVEMTDPGGTRGSIGLEIKAFARPVNVNPATISGTATVGSTLTNTDGFDAADWTGEDSIARKWQRADDSGFTTNLVDISGATGGTYVLVTADTAKYVRCVVTATNIGGTTSSNSTGIGPITDTNPPVNVNPAVIAGTAQRGATLTLTDGDGAEDWTGETSIARQWQRADNLAFTTNVTDIGGATGATYVLATGEVAKYVRCRVRATNANGNTDSNSNIVGAVTDPAAPVNTVAPVASILDSAPLRAGAVLTCTQGSWSNSPLAYAYQWQRSPNGTTGWAGIAGAINSTYVADTADVSYHLRCVVSATNANG